MPLPPPPRELSMQRAHNAKYTQREQDKKRLEREAAIKRMKEFEKEQRDRKHRSKGFAQPDTSSTATGDITIVTIDGVVWTTACNISF
jgi:hypothetical protein